MNKNSLKEIADNNQSRTQVFDAEKLKTLSNTLPEPESSSEFQVKTNKLTNSYFIPAHYVFERTSLAKLKTTKFWKT